MRDFSGYWVSMNSGSVYYTVLLKAAGLLVAGLVVSGCVSDTLSSTNTQSTNAQLINADNQTAPRYDPVQRAEAVAEMREKAANANSGVLTNAYASADGPNEPLSQSDSQARIVALQQEAAQNGVVASDNELDEKQRRIRELQRKAATHYGSAINTIEN